MIGGAAFAMLRMTRETLAGANRHWTLYGLRSAVSKWSRNEPDLQSRRRVSPPGVLKLYCNLVDRGRTGNNSAARSTLLRIHTW